MENASKALMMAGSILIAIMTIGALIFMFDNISGAEKEKYKNAEIESVLEFNRQFEAFDMVGLRGTDILTVVNKMANYNVSNDVTFQGYSKMELEVEFTVDTDGKFKRGTNDLATLLGWFVYDSVGSNKIQSLDPDLTPEKVTEFKRKYFKCIDVGYDNDTSRVISMKFKEIDVK